MERYIHNFDKNSLFQWGLAHYLFSGAADEELKTLSEEQVISKHTSEWVKFVDDYRVLYRYLRESAEKKEFVHPEDLLPDNISQFLARSWLDDEDVSVPEDINLAFAELIVASLLTMSNNANKGSDETRTWFEKWRDRKGYRTRFVCRDTSMITMAVMQELGAWNEDFKVVALFQHAGLAYKKLYLINTNTEDGFGNNVFNNSHKYSDSRQLAMSTSDTGTAFFYCMYSDGKIKLGEFYQMTKKHIHTEPSVKLLFLVAESLLLLFPFEDTSDLLDERPPVELLSGGLSELTRLAVIQYVKGDWWITRARKESFLRVLEWIQRAALDPKIKFDDKYFHCPLSQCMKWMIKGVEDTRYNKNIVHLATLYDALPDFIYYFDENNAIHESVFDLDIISAYPLVGVFYNDIPLFETEVPFHIYKVRNGYTYPIMKGEGRYKNAKGVYFELYGKEIRCMRTVRGAIPWLPVTDIAKTGSHPQAKHVDDWFQKLIKEIKRK